MTLKFLQSRSIKTRVTLFTLAIFVLSIWAISLYVSRTLQDDMQRVLGERHFQTTSMVADEINEDVQYHLSALEVVAKSLGPVLSGGAAKTQKALESRAIFHSLFNSGSFVTGMDGTAIASFPVSTGRMGVNFLEQEDVSNAIRQAKSSVGKPAIDKVLNKPALSMAVPIRDPQGQVIGALVGVIELDKPNLLDKITKALFNKTGLVTVFSPQYRLTVTSSDKTRIMQALPPPGVYPGLDPIIAGFEGYTRVVNLMGQEQLASVKKIPAAQWYLYSGLPTKDIFAPVQAMQQRILMAAILLTLLTGGLTWWMLRRELAPMFDIARKLAQMAEATQTPQSLPVTRQDEIGELISGVNCLLQTLGERETALIEREGRLNEAQRMAKVGSWELDLLSNHLTWSDEIFRILEVDKTQFKPTYEAFLATIHPDDREAVNLVYTQSLEARTPYGIEHRFLFTDGRVKYVLEQCETTFSDTGQALHSRGTVQDITERKAAQDEIQRLAFSDPLTGLPNRRLLSDRLEHALVGALRHKHQAALLFVDMDDFKTLNDTLGHDKGDQLLQQIAGRMLACVREGDTVARLGGDEFVVLLEDLDANLQEAATQAEVMAKKINYALRQPYQLDRHDYRSSASIGITLFGGTQRESIEEPLKRAELAMYKVKAEGRNNLLFFEPEMRAAVSARAALESDLHEALAKEQFLLHYQAQFDAAHLTGVEALLRWQHPERGLISPGEFIPVAEANGLILPLGHWVLQTACQQLALWALQPEKAHLTIAVNVSVRQFRQSSFVQDVLGVLTATGANPKRLKLELTESLLLDNMNDIIVKMNALKASGVGFSLDDFGTGYSSLAYLKRLPLDQLKIDQGFVRDILTDPNDAAIAKMVIALAESMGLNVIAEGVETQAQCDALDDLGCHAYQGYLFSKPLPIEEFEAFARRA